MSRLLVSNSHYLLLGFVISSLQDGLTSSESETLPPLTPNMLPPLPKTNSVDSAGSKFNHSDQSNMTSSDQNLYEKARPGFKLVRKRDYSNKPNLREVLQSLQERYKIQEFIRQVIECPSISSATTRKLVKQANAKLAALKD